MNEISFDFDFDLNDREDCLILHFRVIIDGRDLLHQRPGDTICFPELFESFYESGEYHIPTCSCGIPECGGYYAPTIVGHGAAWVSWIVPDPIGVECQFGLNQFKESVVDLRSRLLALNSREPIEKLEHWPDYNSDSVSRFLRFIKSDGGADLVYPSSRFGLYRK